MTRVAAVEVLPLGTAETGKIADVITNVEVIATTVADSKVMAGPAVPRRGTRLLSSQLLERKVATEHMQDMAATLRRLAWVRLLVCRLVVLAWRLLQVFPAASTLSCNSMHKGVRLRHLHHQVRLLRRRPVTNLHLPRPRVPKSAVAT